MDLLSLPVAIVAAVSVALLSRAIQHLWLRALLVIAVAYGAAFVSLEVASRLSADDQFGSWTPLLLHLSFGAGAAASIVALLVSNWLLKPRKQHAG